MAQWAVRMAETILKREPVLPVNWGYDYELVYRAFYLLYRQTGDRRYFDYIKTNMDRCIDQDGTILCYENKQNIDHLNLGKSLILLYRQTGDLRYKTAADTLRAQIDSQPRTREGGFWHKAIYPDQMWLDGLYMGSAFYALYAKEFDQPEAFSDIAHQFILMYERAKDSKTGLLYHAYDAERRQRWADPVTGCSPHFWGRAMGWYFMAITESLACFPKGHPSIPRLLEILRAVADAVVRYQDKESGLWYQVLDCGGRDGNYWEASASAMFTFALCRAAELGYLDARYRQAAERGFAGIIAHLTQVCDDGTMDLNQVCEVAGLGGQPYRDGSYDYYVHESIKTNDFKGAGPFMLAALWLDR